jgi:outer membrane protein W
LIGIFNIQFAIFLECKESGIFAKKDSPKKTCVYLLKKCMNQIFKTLLLIFFICSFSNSLLAQKFSKRKPAIGFSVGTEFLSEKLPKTTLSTNVGLFYQYHFSENFSLATTLSLANREYSQKHVAYFSIGNRSFYEKKEKESATTVEFNCKYHFVDVDYDFSYFLGIGFSKRFVFQNHILITEDFEIPFDILSSYDYSTSREINIFTPLNLNAGFDYKNSDRVFLSTQVGVNIFQNRENGLSIKAHKSNVYLKIGIGWSLK